MKVGIRRLFIIACYTPVDGEISEVNDAFWESLNDILAASDPWSRIILLKAINGCVDVQHEGTNRVLGHFGDPNINGNGEKLISLGLENVLFNKNNWFRHNMIHVDTWARGESRTIIDFIVADRRLRSLVRDIREKRDHECE